MPAVAVAEIEEPAVAVPAAPVFPDDAPRACVYGSTGPHGCAPTGPDWAHEPTIADVVYPELRHALMSVHLNLWEQFPWKCARAIQDCHKGWRQRIANAASVYVAEQLKVEAAKIGWPWMSYLAIVGGGALGLAVGIAIGVLAGL